MPSLCQKAALDLQNSCSKLLTAVLGKEKNSCFEKTAVLKIKKNALNMFHIRFDRILFLDMNCMHEEYIRMHMRMHASHTIMTRMHYKY